MSARYKVHLKDQTGTLVAIFDDFTNLEINKRLNSISTYNFQFQGNDDRISLFEIDGQVEIWRSDPINDIAWYLEFE